MKNDILKEKIMSNYRAMSEEEYWKTLDAFCDNLLEDYETLISIRKYIETHNINDLTIKAEQVIAQVYFGGYKYGRN